MYVYEKCNGESFFVVGHYDPQGKWHTESDQNTREEAAARCNYLNGSNHGE